MLKVNNTLKILGIDGCANTVVGDGEYFAIASSIIVVISCNVTTILPDHRDAQRSEWRPEEKSDRW